ncbi:hypothetical protein BV25DRAFT_1819338 [Artomyces pyxidatus]|uniref:Uncharacterized protein n=1 Tax=Artomyces pyxidatus TaxID=48021 RepID=A0ACB8THJ8_9AGAM|nr:hypothetical protein BV25DRAFT_1819338 [Artomyces pyxidatus]
MHRSKSTGQQLFRKTKKWDQTAFSKTGPSRRKTDKGKGKAGPDADIDDEEQVEFEQFPAPFVSSESNIPLEAAQLLTC